MKKNAIILIMMALLSACSSSQFNKRSYELKGMKLERQVTVVSSKGTQPKLTFNYKLKELNEKDGLLEFKHFLSEELNCSIEDIAISYHSFKAKDLSPVLCNYTKKMQEERYSVVGKLSIEASDLKIAIKKTNFRAKNIFSTPFKRIDGKAVLSLKKISTVINFGLITIHTKRTRPRFR